MLQIAFEQRKSTNYIKEGISFKGSLMTVTNLPGYDGINSLYLSGKNISSI